MDGQSAKLRAPPIPEPSRAVSEWRGYGVGITRVTRTRRHHEGGTISTWVGTYRGTWCGGVVVWWGVRGCSKRECLRDGEVSVWRLSGGCCSYAYV